MSTQISPHGKVVEDCGRKSPCPMCESVPVVKPVTTPPANLWEQWVIIMAILVWRDRNAVGATALGRTDRGTTLKPGSKTTLSTALTAMSDYRKDFLGQTIIDNIREYDPRLGRKEAELG